MLQVPALILDQAASTYGVEPLLYMDIWPVKGAQRKLKTSSDWAGAFDLVQVLDSNVSASRVDGALVLGAGSAVSLVSSNHTGLVAHRMVQTIGKHGRWETRGNWLTGKRRAHLGYTTTHVRKDAPVYLSFVASGTFLADSIRLITSNAGNSATVLSLRVLSVAGNQIGNIGKASVAAGQAQTVVDITGMAATLRKGASYRLELNYSAPNAPGVPFTYTSYTVDISVYSYALTGISHTLAISDATGFEIGGNNGYAASGAAIRTLDVAEIPLGDGIVSFRDIVPSGADPTSLSIDLYYTDSATVAAEADLTNWVNYGVVASGDTVPAHRYWRASIAMASNSLNDETPELHELSISYVGDPIVFGVRSETSEITASNGILTQSVQVGLNGVSTASAQITPKLKSSMIGRISVQLAPDDIVHSLMVNPLHGRPCRIRAGYVGVSETFVIYEGLVRDMAFSRGAYTLTVQDTIELADVQVPRKKAGLAWDAVKAYQAADMVIYGTNSWLALANDTGTTPGTNAAVWQDNGTVWLDIGYTSATNGGTAWHLADIAKDLILNRINIQTQRVNLASLESFKTRYPSRTGNRILTKPAKAFAMLSEIAWLLEAQWVIRNGQLTLIAEPQVTDLAVESITPHDIAEGLQYRRGWADLKNEVLILSAYSGVGDSNAQFSNGFAIADADSINKYDMVSLETFEDKWGVPEVEVNSVATSFLNRWKDGRRIVTCTAAMRLLRLEPGDVVDFESAQLPSGDGQGLRMMVVRKDLDWKRQQLKLSLLEVL